MIFALICILTSYTFAAPMGIQEEWSRISDPLVMGKNFEIRFYMLPLKASVDKPGRYWSGDYWAMNKGNINKRWNAKVQSGYNSPTKEQAQLMSETQLAQLSPAEKYDLLMGRYWYPLKQEVARITDYDAESWEGICHGWAPASMNHAEPTPKTLKNPDGIMIPFGSSDIKGLISYFYAFPYQVPSTYQVGRRCDRTVLDTNEDCKQDLNAGAFHIVLANKIGLENKGIVADLNRFRQVWNHPIFAYSTRILSEGGPKSDSAPGTTRTVNVSTTVSYVSSASNSWNPQNGTRAHSIESMVFNYVIEIDGYGNILGGMWKSVQRPDFLWIKDAPLKFGGNYLRMNELLND